MAWREAEDVRGGPATDRLLDQVEGVLRQDERVRLVASPSAFFDVSGNMHKYVGLLVSDQRVIVAESAGLIRKSLIVTDFPIGEFERYGIEPLRGVGPTWVSATELSSGMIRFYFDSQSEAEMVAQYINSGVLYWRNRDT